MDCYFHSHVPSIAPCNDCGKPICATCRDERGECPSCRLAQKIDAATAPRQPLGGRRTSTAGPEAAPGNPQPTVTVTRAVAMHSGDDPVESRALIALGYPLWPLALLGLLDRKQSTYLRRQTYQALGFNLGMWAFGGLLTLLAGVPFLGFSAEVLLPFLVPIFLVASIFYGYKVWNGEDVRVPILTDWIDDRLPINP